MTANINDIVVSGRIRKEVSKIDELAADISINGLINPLTVMATANDGEYRLIAGLRRLKAVQSLGWTEIEVNVISPADAEAELLIEIAENEHREPFTFTEKMDYARLLEEIEKTKALDRMSVGGMGGVEYIQEGTDPGPYLQAGERRDIIGAKIGMSGRQYDRAKYIAENAAPEIIEQLDKGDRTIRPTYDELKKSGPAVDKKPQESVGSEQSQEPAAENMPQKADAEPSQIANPLKTDKVSQSKPKKQKANGESSTKAQTPESVSPEAPVKPTKPAKPAKIVEPFEPEKSELLIKEEPHEYYEEYDNDCTPHQRDVSLLIMENEQLKTEIGCLRNNILLYESGVKGYERRIAELETALAAANAKVAELEANISDTD